VTRKKWAIKNPALYKIGDKIKLLEAPRQPKGIIIDIEIKRTTGDNRLYRDYKIISHDKISWCSEDYIVKV
jgi:hypothetical protein